MTRSSFCAIDRTKVTAWDGSGASLRAARIQTLAAMAQAIAARTVQRAAWFSDAARANAQYQTGKTTISVRPAKASGRFNDAATTRTAVRTTSASGSRTASCL